MVIVWMHKFPHNDHTSQFSVYGSNDFSIWNFLGGSDWMSPDCGGSLITKLHVISAGHCIADARGELWVKEME